MIWPFKKKKYLPRSGDYFMVSRNRFTNKQDFDGTIWFDLGQNNGYVLARPADEPKGEQVFIKIEDHDFYPAISMLKKLNEIDGNISFISALDETSVINFFRKNSATFAVYEPYLRECLAQENIYDRAPETRVELADCLSDVTEINIGTEPSPLPPELPQPQQEETTMPVLKSATKKAKPKAKAKPVKKTAKKKAA